MDFVWRHVTVGILPNGFQTHTPFASLHAFVFVGFLQ